MACSVLGISLVVCTVWHTAAASLACTWDVQRGTARRVRLGHLGSQPRAAQATHVDGLGTDRQRARQVRGHCGEACRENAPVGLHCFVVVAHKLDVRMKFLRGKRYTPMYNYKSLHKLFFLHR